MDPPRDGLQDLDVSRRRTSVVSIVSNHGLGNGWYDLLDVELLDLIVDVDGVFVKERRVGLRTEDGEREGRGEGVFVGGGVPTSFGWENRKRESVGSVPTSLSGGRGLREQR